MTKEKQIEGITQYYVLRNKDTGMYFRGKGVNRWGKHFNQATIYRIKGTAEASVREAAWHGEKAEIVPIQIFEGEGYRKASDVAEEIIGEILSNNTPDIDGFFTMHETELIELKKKYTEDGK